jgi:hypothetical protein
MLMLIFIEKIISRILSLTGNFKSVVKYIICSPNKIIPALFFISAFLANGQSPYTEYFKAGRLRFDYAITSKSGICKIFPYHYYYEPMWGGSKINLIDSLKYGTMMLEVYDSASNRLIYSYGYSTLFKEWESTDINNEKNKIFIESVLIPYPLKTIKIKIYGRDKLLNFNKIYNNYYNPELAQVEVLNEPVNCEIKNIIHAGDPGEKVDLVFISEGYTLESKGKFFADVEKYTQILFSWDPYKAYTNSFNIYAVYIASEQSGADIPPDSIWVSTALNSRFYTFGTERYLTTEDMEKVRNCLSGVPYDQVCIMVNTDKYGGGGIYNFYTVFAADNANSEFLFQHEFGHAFAGLADEYYTSETPYDSLFSKITEPFEPNITTLSSFDKKWKNMVNDSVPIPTPSNEKYLNVVGVYEGAGYCEKGIYRSYIDCSMKSKINNAFCPVCKRAIKRKIELKDNSIKTSK